MTQLSETAREAGIGELRFTPESGAEQREQWSAEIIKGAHDALRESAKQFRLLGDGHAALCDAHADRLAKLLTDRRKAPWPDFAGNDLYEGDTIRPPNGDTGIVFYDEKYPLSWRVQYLDQPAGVSPYLAHQIGPRDRAVKVSP